MTDTRIYMNMNRDMRRSCDSLNSLKSFNSLNSLPSATSLSSISSRNKRINHTNIEEEIIHVSNLYYYFSEKYDKKINNIVNRYENRTNKLFMDLRHREVEYKNIDYLFKKANAVAAATAAATVVAADYKHIYLDDEEIERHYRYILRILYLYTFVVLVMVWNIC